MAAPPQPLSVPEYEQDFLAILRNEKNDEDGEGRSVRRTRGFVALVRGASSLKPLQDLCFQDTRQTSNTCLTARYRLQPQKALGTLLFALLSDLKRITLKEKEVGELIPAASEDSWVRTASHYLHVLGNKEDLLAAQKRGVGVFRSANLAHEIGSARVGSIENYKLGTICRSFNEVLRPDDRLLLFGEISEGPADINEWSVAMESLFNRLPESVGVIISGAPEEFKLPTDDPHFLELTLPERESGDPNAQVAYKYIESSFHSDVPADKDELGVDRYAEAISRFVLHPQTKPPITIGIHGPWGKGKSSFMKLIDRALVKYAEVNQADNTQKWNDVSTKLRQAESLQAKMSTSEQADSEKDQRLREYERLREEETTLWHKMTEAAHHNVLRIRFNAWQFEDAKQTWAGLASVISEQMEELLPRRARFWLKTKYAWKYRRSEVVINLLVPFGIFTIFAILFGFGLMKTIAAQDSSAVSNILKLVLPAGSMILSAWYITSQFVKVAQPISERVLNYVTMPNYREQMGFQHRVKADVQFVYGFLAHRLNTSAFNRIGTFRVVVYIDDLDRCSENKIMEVLQAINLILADCEFFVFVGMDTEMIYRAIKAHYKENVSDQFAENYLSKIIQISFYLPDTNLQRRIAYLGTLFSLSSRLELQNLATEGGQTSPKGDDAASSTLSDGSLEYDISQLLKIVPAVQVKETEDTPHELQAFTDYSDFIDDNPREMKRLINIHRLIKILVQKADAPLHRDRQKKLVKWLIFCDSWPHLVANALDQAAKTPLSKNCLLDLAQSLSAARANPSSTAELPWFDGLAEFAEFTPSAKSAPTSTKASAAQKTLILEEKRVYSLSAEDLDDEFRLAAKLSQMVRKPAHRA